MRNLFVVEITFQRQREYEQLLLWGSRCSAFLRISPSVASYSTLVLAIVPETRLLPLHRGWVFFDPINFNHCYYFIPGSPPVHVSSAGVKVCPKITVTSITRINSRQAVSPGECIWGKLP